MENIILKILTINFIGACIAISVLMEITKRLAGDIILKPWWKRFVSPLLPLAFSSGIAFIPNILPGAKYGERWLWGVVATLFSHIVYNLIKKRFYEDQTIPTLENITDAKKEMEKKLKDSKEEILEKEIREKVIPEDKSEESKKEIKEESKEELVKKEPEKDEDTTPVMVMQQDFKKTKKVKKFKKSKHSKLKDMNDEKSK